MVEFKITGGTPLEALSSLTAFGMHCMKAPDVYAAACRILEAEMHEEMLLADQAQAGAVPTQNGATQLQPEAAVPEPVANTPKPVPAPAVAPGPADGAKGQTPAPGDKQSPAPTVEQVRAKGIEASRKYGKEAVVAILRKFGASGMSAIAEKDRAAFLAELEGLDEGNA